MICAHQANVPIVQDVDTGNILSRNADGTNREVDLPRPHRANQALREQRDDVDADERRDARQLVHKPRQEVDLCDVGHRHPEGSLGHAWIEHDTTLQGRLSSSKAWSSGSCKSNGCIRRKHAVRHPDEQWIAEALPQSPQGMADRRLGQAEALARGGETAKIPNCEKDTQQIEVKMVLTWLMQRIITMNLTLVQPGRHRLLRASTQPLFKRAFEEPRERSAADERDEFPVVHCESPTAVRLIGFADVIGDVE